MRKRNLTIRPYEMGRDYPEICEWWRAHQWQYIPTHRLPKVGFIVESEGVKICAGFLYLMEAGWTMLEWLVTNPNSPVLARKPALELIATTAKEVAKGYGAESVFSSVANENLAKLLQGQGFKVGDMNMTNLVAVLS